jgi:glycosyltransferase involved in cell wall biosynthesis
MKHVVPSGARVYIKKRIPKTVEQLAIGLDLIPLILDARNWPRLLNPRPLPHPLSTKMWCGFGDAAAEKLEDSKLSAQGRHWVTAPAAWSLAQWHAHKGNYRRALDNLLLLTTAAPKFRRSVYTQLMVVDCLLKLDRPEEAQTWLQWASKRTQGRAELYFSAANIRHALAIRAGDISAADVERLALLNRTYEEAGFSVIRKRDEKLPLTLHNIEVAHPRPVDATAKLSILMPAYNCADTLPIALQSILDQTWHNLEVVVVDDQSQDDTWRIIQSFAAKDSRVIPVRHECNGGAYAARNTALANATGEFVTVHDADDWSHPEKFAAQMLHTMSQPVAVSTTIGVRVSHDLRFDVKANMAGMLMENTSSLLLRRQILVDLGGWDSTRMGADSELYERVKARHNLVTNKLFPAVPLTLILFSGSSLTQTKAAGLATVNYGARRQYKEAYRFWHSTELSKAEPDLKMTAERRFPAPRVMLGFKGLIEDIDVIFVGNFADRDRSFDQHIVGWEILAKSGQRLGILHWPTFRRAEANIVSPIRAAIARGLVENIVPGEVVACETVFVLDAQLLDNPPAPLPEIRAKRVFVVGKELSDQQQLLSQRDFGCAAATIEEFDVQALMGSISD